MGFAGPVQADIAPGYRAILWPPVPTAKLPETQQLHGRPLSLIGSKKLGSAAIAAVFGDRPLEPPPAAETEDEDPKPPAAKSHDVEDAKPPAPPAEVDARLISQSVDIVIYPTLVRFRSLAQLEAGPESGTPLVMGIPVHLQGAQPLAVRGLKVSLDGEPIETTIEAREVPDRRRIDRAVYRDGQSLDEVLAKAKAEGWTTTERWAVWSLNLPASKSAALSVDYSQIFVGYAAIADRVASVSYDPHGDVMFRGPVGKAAVRVTLVGLKRDAVQRINHGVDSDLKRSWTEREPDRTDLAVLSVTAPEATELPSTNPAPAYVAELSEQDQLADFIVRTARHPSLKRVDDDTLALGVRLIDTLRQAATSADEGTRSDALSLLDHLRLGPDNIEGPKTAFDFGCSASLPELQTPPREGLPFDAIFFDLGNGVPELSRYWRDNCVEQRTQTSAAGIALVLVGGILAALSWKRRRRP